MALTFRDEAALNNAFGNLDQTLMQNRMMKQEQARQQQEQQRLTQNEAATQQYRMASLGNKEDEQKILNELAQARLKETTTKDTTNAQINQEKADTEKGKVKVTLYTPDGSAVGIPKDQVDAYKANFATTHPGQQLSETNPFEKTLDVGGQQLTFYTQNAYDKAALAWKQHQDEMAKGTAPKVTQVVKTGTEGGFPINETNTTTTATSPQPALSGPATPQFTKGQKVQQNGVTYQYDGQNWNPVTQ